ncbi:Multidrug resistance protein MdtE precursor [Roseovarius gaetbuli]|uniref:Multidrug resistance protein MdtE n=2 Tax=Roseovarius gaetbuli TaxID=1356575 RepID=A0A1X6ZS34_9RHOB|nr:Multidrug resistance protein MdtE precursor [Roseovarius gaetbuli]
MLQRMSIIGLLMLGTAPAHALDIRSCVVMPSQVVEIAVEVPGLVKSVNVGRGDVVKEGDVLLKLTDTALQAQVALATRRASDETQITGVDARIKVLEGQLERVKILYERELIAMRELDRVEAELIGLYQERDRVIADRDLAAIELTRINALLDQRTVISPVNGIVTARNADAGEYADEQGAVMSIATLDPLHVEIFVPQDMANQIEIGAEIEIRLETQPDLAHTAVVEVVDRVFDAASGTFGVRLSLPNPGQSLPAGVRCTARL